MEFFPQRTKLLEAVGIAPQRDGRVGPDVGEHTAKFRVRLERLGDRFTKAWAGGPHDPFPRPHEHLPAGLVDFHLDHVVEREILHRPHRLDPLGHRRQRAGVAAGLRFCEFEELDERDVGDPALIDLKVEFLSGHRAGDRRGIGEHFFHGGGRVGEPVGLERAALDLRLELRSPGGRLGGADAVFVGRLLAFFHLDLGRCHRGGERDPRLSGKGGGCRHGAGLLGEIGHFAFDQRSRLVELLELPLEFGSLGPGLRGRGEHDLLHAATDHHHEDDENADDVRDDIEKRILAGRTDVFWLGAGHGGGFLERAAEPGSTVFVQITGALHGRQIANLVLVAAGARVEPAVGEQAFEIVAPRPAVGGGGEHELRLPIHPLAREPPLSDAGMHGLHERINGRGRVAVERNPVPDPPAAIVENPKLVERTLHLDRPRQWNRAILRGEARPVLAAGLGDRRGARCRVRAGPDLLVLPAADLPTRLSTALHEPRHRRTTRRGHALRGTTARRGTAAGSAGPRLRSSDVHRDRPAATTSATRVAIAIPATTATSTTTAAGC